MSLAMVLKLLVRLWGLFGLIGLFVVATLDSTGAEGEAHIQRGPGEVHDYCAWEDFEASCGPDEVIVVTAAKYGRMALGRCVKRNYGYLGCALDALAYVDARCSGRRQCAFSVFEDSLRELQPCPEDISAYIEASYSCVKAATGSQRKCQSEHHTKLKGPSGYIATMETEEHGYGSAECPWRIQVSPGQRINITIFNFARHSLATSGVGGGSIRPEVCYEIGEVIEKADRKRITLCDALGRQTSIYVSKTNTVSMQFVSGPTLRSLGAFLFKYDVVGCPDVKAPPGADLKRDGDHLTVVCGPVTRSLTCSGSTWIGDVGNCTLAGTQKGGTVYAGDTEFPYGILIVVSIGVALGVFFGGLLLSVAVMYMRRRQRDEDRKLREQRHHQVEQYDPYDPESHLCFPVGPPGDELAKTFTAAATASPGGTAHTCPALQSQTCPAAAAAAAAVGGLDSSTTVGSRELDILKQSCPYGTSPRGYCPTATRAHFYESPKFV